MTTNEAVFLPFRTNAVVWIVLPAPADAYR